MGHLVRTTILVVVIALGAVIASCSSKPEPKPSRVVYKISATADANQSSPVVVRLFQLQSSGQFESAEFFKLFDDESGALGATLIARKELQLWPSQQQEITEDLQPTTRSVGILAGLKDLDVGQWRAVVPVTQNETTTVEVTLGRSSMTARAAK